MTPHAIAAAHADRLACHSPRCPVHGTVLIQGWTLTPRGAGEIARPTGVWSCFACEQAADAQQFRAEFGAEGAK